MKYRKKINKKLFLIYAVLFAIPFFGFMQEGKLFTAIILVLTTILNLFSWRQMPKRIAPISVSIHLFNAIVSVAIGYDYLSYNSTYLHYLWFIAAIYFIGASIYQIVNILENRNAKRKKARRRH